MKDLKLGSLDCDLVIISVGSQRTQILTLVAELQFVFAKQKNNKSCARAAGLHRRSRLLPISDIFEKLCNKPFVLLHIKGNGDIYSRGGHPVVIAHATFQCCVFVTENGR